MLREVQSWLPKADLGTFIDWWKEHHAAEAADDAVLRREATLREGLEELRVEEIQKQEMENAEALSREDEPEDMEWINDFLHVRKSEDRILAGKELQRLRRQQPLSQRQAEAFEAFTQNVGEGYFKAMWFGAPGPGKS
jgi:hypothetical protein